MKITMSTLATCLFLLSVACAGSPSVSTPPPAAPVSAPVPAPQEHVGHQAGSPEPEAIGSIKDPYANAACPIMAKPASGKLYAQTVHGRLYVCCKPCINDIAEDVETAYKSAYPHVQTHANTVCPVTGQALGDAAVTVSIQGHAFRVLDAESAKVAAQDALRVLNTLLANEKGNQ